MSAQTRSTGGMRKCLQIVLLILPLWLGIQAVFPQNIEASFEQISTAEGLSDSRVTQILRDKHGFMWFGTYKGLNRYDGYTFVSYVHDPSDSSSIVGDLIRFLYEDRQGNIWVGTQSQGISKYNYSQARFENYYPQLTEEDPLFAQTAIFCLLQDKHNTIWLGTSHGLYYQQEGNSEFLKAPIHAQIEIPGAEIIHALHEDRNGTLWLGSEAGLIAWNPTKGKIQLYQHRDEDPKSLADNNVQSIFESKAGELFITSSNGINVFRLAYAQVPPFPLSHEQGFKLFNADNQYQVPDPRSQVQAITEDQRGNIWIGSFGGGIVRYNPYTGKTSHFESGQGQSKYLSSNEVLSLYQDPSGLLWVGTYFGINKLDFSKVRFSRLQNTRTQPELLASNEVYAISEDQQGNRWIGTDNGLSFLPIDLSKPIHFYADKKSGSLSGNEIFALLSDHMGNLWVGTGAHGLNLLTAKNLSESKYRFTQFRYQENKPYSLLSDRILSLHEDDQHGIWVGSSQGLNRLFFDSNIIESFPFMAQADSGLYHPEVLCLQGDQKGNLWIGTGGGLNLYNSESKRIERPFPHSALAKLPIHAVYEDTQSALWVGTEGGGLFRIAPDRQHIQAFTPEHGLPDNSVYSILADEERQLWLSTNAGLARVKELPSNTLSIVTYTQRKDALPSDGFNIGAAYKNEQGLMYFGTDAGVVAFHLDHIRQNTYIPPVVITDFKLFFEEVPVDPEGILSKNITQTQALTLSHEQNVLFFEFAAMSYLQNERNEFAYMLEGADKDWNYLKNQRSATFTYLDPGNYTLRVKASNNDGIWNEEGISLAITITPPFYRTTAFYIFCVLLIILGVFGVIKYRTRSLEQNKRMLETQVSLRTEELSNKKEELEDALAHLKSTQSQLVEKEKMASLGQLTAGVAHEINNPITFVIGNINPLKRDVEDILEILREYEASVESLSLKEKFHKVEQLKEELEYGYIIQEIQELLKGIEEGASRTSVIVKGLRNFSRLDEEEYKLANVNESLDSTLLILNNQIKGHIEIVKDYGDIPDVMCYPGKMNQVYMNVLVNAIQAIEGEGRITIRTRLQDDWLTVTIQDTGQGMSEEIRQRIFEPFYTTKEVGQGTGLGLSITFGIIEAHQGKIEVISAPGEGTTFCILLPMVKEFEGD